MKNISLLLLLIFSGISFKQKDIIWVAIGDSITYLNNHTDETGNRVSKGYITLVTEALPEIRYVNQGHNGWTSGDIAEKINSLGLTKADMYSVFLGTNDWWRGRPLGELSDYVNNTGNNTVYGSFRIIIDKLRQLNAAADIILITPMQRGDFVYIGDMNNNAYGSYKEKNGQTLEQFAQAIKNIGKHEQFPVVDLYHAKGMGVKKMVKFKRLKDPRTGNYRNYRYPKYVNVPFYPGTHQYPYPVEAVDVTYDGLHPSDKGNRMIAEKIVPVMRKLISDDGKDHRKTN